jgi:hypothetical protein
VVAVDAVHAALRGVGEDVFVECGLADALGDIFFFGKRLASGFVLYEFNAEEQTEATDFAYMGVRLQRGYFGAKNFRGGLHAIEKIVRFDVIEDGVARGGGNGMCLIGEAVLEGAGAAFECFHDARRYEGGAEGRVTAGDSLPDQDDVWLDVPVLDREWFAGATHAAHDFVGDEENAALTTDFGDTLGIAVRWDGCTERGADDGLKDERGDTGGVICVQKTIEVVCAGYSAVGKFFVEGAVVAEAGGDVSPFGEERLIGRAAGDIAADSHGTESAAVVALAAGDNAKARCLSIFEMKLTR